MILNASRSALVFSTVVVSMVYPVTCSAGLLFSEDFEAGHLNQWTPKSGGVHSGEIVLDPLDPANHVVHFKSRISRGDIFSMPVTITDPNEIISLEFDFLGINDTGGTPVNSGGYLGLARQLDTSSSAGSDSHIWLANTTETPGRTLLIDDATWHHYEIDISGVVRKWFDLYGGATGSIDLYVIVEDFDDSQLIVDGTARPGDAYFDNIQITSSPPVINAVPEASSLASLLGAIVGLGSIRVLRRRLVRKISV